MAAVEIRTNVPPGANGSLVCQFRVTGGGQVRVERTDAAGKATLDLPDGQYALEVVQPPQFFIGPKDPVKFTVPGASPVVVNLQGLQLTVELTGIAPGDAEAVAQPVEFRAVRDEDGQRLPGVLVSQAKPVKVRLPLPGSWRVLQVAAPRPYGLWSVPREETVEVNAATPAKTATFLQRKLTLSAQVSSEDPAADRAGAKLALQTSAGVDWEIVETSADGKATFNPPQVGLQRVDLRSPPPGFFAPYERTKPVEVTEAPGGPVVFVVVPSSQQQPGRLGFWASLAIVAVLGVLGGLLLAWRLPAGSASVPAAAAVWVVAAFLLLLTGINLRRGFFEPLIGADNRTSTSRVAPAVWTLSLIWAIAFLLLEAGAKQDRVKAAFPADRWDDYVLLLGGPFAAFVIAKGVTAWKVQNGQLQKANNDGNSTPAQVFKNDDGTTSLVDAQYLGFNLVALVYFWAVVLQGLKRGASTTWVLPIIPNQLLALTSAAALTYAANKAIQNNKPSITAIEPASARPGETVRIRGRNFRPDGVTQSDSVSVTIEGVGACVVQEQTDTTLEITVPLVLQP